MQNPQRVIEYARLAAIQDGVNNALVGANWRLRVQYHGRDVAYNVVPLDYPVAALDEAFELFRSVVPFKWWTKEQKVDVANGLVELVDILHFGLSYEIATADCQEHATDEEVYTLVAEEILSSAGTWFVVKALSRDADAAHTQTSLYDVRCTLLTFIKMLTVCSFDWTNYWRLVHLLGSTPEEIASMYVAKAALNKFRKENGYKEGTYRKMWRTQGGELEEDNVHVMRYAQSYAHTQGFSAAENELHTFMSQVYHSPFNTVEPHALGMQLSADQSRDSQPQL